MDGSLIFKNAQDEANENAVAAELERAWGCTLTPFALLSPIDWFAERRGRMVGVLELKCRSHSSTRHLTVYLNVRKWLALQLAATGLGLPAIFIVRFDDGIYWIEVGSVTGFSVKVGGGYRTGHRSEFEPVIEVPIKAMHRLEGSHVQDHPLGRP